MRLQTVQYKLVEMVYNASVKRSVQSRVIISLAPYGVCKARKNKLECQPQRGIYYTIEKVN
jgi:hypothetical protein